MINFQKIRQQPTWGTVLRELAANSIQLFFILYGLKCIVTLHGHLDRPSEWIMGSFYMAPVTGMASVMAGLRYIMWAIFLDLCVGSPWNQRWFRRIFRTIFCVGCLVAALWFGHESQNLRINSNDSFFNFLPNIKTKEDARVLFLTGLFVGFIFVFIALQVFLFIIFYREQVKKDLRARVCQPIHIRWRPPPSIWRFSPNWNGTYQRYYSTKFHVVYSDPRGFIHEALCVVYRPLMANPIWGSLRVEWLTDKVTVVPPPEVWVSDEIIRPKLGNQDFSTGTNRFLEDTDERPE